MCRLSVLVLLLQGAVLAHLPLVIQWFVSCQQNNKISQYVVNAEAKAKLIWYGFNILSAILMTISENL